MYLTVKSDELQKIVETSDLPIVVYFYASWCGPCRKMGPEFESLSGELEGLYKFLKISVDDSEEAAIDFKVTAVPTLIFIREGKEIRRASGFQTKEEIRNSMAEAFN